MVVLCGCQGADNDAGILALTDSYLTLLLGELSVLAREQPSLIVGDFNVEPTKIPCVATGILAGLYVVLEVAWALAGGVGPAVTCKSDFMVGCPLAAAAVSNCRVELGR